MNKKKLVLYPIIIYLTMISIVTTLWFMMSLIDILTNGNIVAFIAIVINLGVFILNVRFFSMKDEKKDYKIILVCNSIYCLFSGFGVKAAGFLIVYDLGFNFGLFLSKTNKTTIGFNYESFNLIFKFLRYDSVAYPGFSIHINLIMIALFVTLIYIYNKMRKAGSVSKQLISD